MAGSPFTISVVLDPSGAVRGAGVVEGSLRKVENQADKLRRLLRQTFAFAGISLGVRQLIELADATLQVQNRLRVVTQSEAQLASVTEQLFGIVRRTRTEFQSTAELYSRVAINSRELGFSQKQLLQFTESLNQAIIISGASAKEASAGLIQLTQGLASGALRGDELRSVLEQLPVVADTIAKQLGVTRGELRILGQEGKISARDVIDSFLNAQDSLSSTFEKTIPTIGQAFTVLRNAAIEFFNDIEGGSGIFSKFGVLILKVADNFEVFARLAIGAGTAISVHFVQRGINSAILALQRLTLAMLANPFTALLTAITIVISFLAAFSDEIDISSDSAANLQDVAVAAFNNISAAIQSFIDLFPTAFPEILAAFTAIFGEIEFNFRESFIFIGVFIDTTIGLFYALGNVIRAVFKGLPLALLDFTEQGIDKFLDFIEFITSAIAAFFLTVAQTAQKIVGAMINSFRFLAQAAQEVLSGNIETAVVLGEGAANALASGIEAAFSSIPDSFEKNLADTTENRLLPRMNGIFKDGASDLGEAVVDGFLEGMDVDFAQGIVGQILADAEAAAEARQIALFKNSQADTGGGVPSGPASTNSGIKEKLALLQRENELIADNFALSKEGFAIKKAIFDVEEELSKKNLTFKEGEREALEALLIVQSQLNLQQQANQEAIAAGLGPQEELNRRLEALKIIGIEAAGGLDEYNKRLRELNIEQAALGDSAFDGFVLGFAQIQDTVGTTADVIQKSFLATFDAITSGLTQFVRDGELDIKEFTRNFLASIAQIIAQLLLLQALKAAFGGSQIGALLGFEKGGDVGANEPIIVGEGGPEVFNPSTSGQIIPNDAVQAAMGTNQGGGQTIVNVAAPIVNVPITNVSDPDEVPSAIESPEGERAVLNVIRKNPRVVGRSGSF